MPIPNRAGNGDPNKRPPMGQVRPVGLGTVAPGGAGSSTLTFNVDRFLDLRDLTLSDSGGIVTSISSVSVDGKNVYIGNAIPGTALRDTNLARLPFRFGSNSRAQRTVVVVATVSGAGTWGATALAMVADD